MLFSVYAFPESNSVDEGMRQSVLYRTSLEKRAFASAAYLCSVGRPNKGGKGRARRYHGLDRLPNLL